MAMRTHIFSTLIGLTTVSVCMSLPVQAATFNYDQLKNISSRPINSENRLTFSGEPFQNQGYTVFSNLNPISLDSGHQVINLNGVGNAPYYVTGRQGSPEVPPSYATRATSLNEIAGFPMFSKYIKNNGITLDNVGFAFGQKSDRDFTKTWNLGDDRLGKDWFASSDSTIEERIYKANPDDVEAFLSFDRQKIVDFGYSDIYGAINYGATTSVSDDSDVAFTDPMTVKKVIGLDPIEDALANAFLQDVVAGGGKVQLVHEEYQPDETNFILGNGFGGINLRFGASIQVVSTRSVPEPSLALGLLMFGIFNAIYFSKKPENS
ncbi:hypothetical protein NIES4072_26190 [Nostoc commune NIES-4072]|uniref:PEP-CTERM protein-sorting domain-containing protein n=1 Tax=Nostoc commune NIES-4072 TaxID=2005467 RepID=A0A2R5FTE8_NOSCO|nr:hypothetical protein [Nostoc commune]BBD63725.1 hypothetical protein NIES4070_00670 [Nostoc commune HK-02]GBG18954.1 hypothetical protein NIES4072_26190 [Nostoc commune NIES-4072]